MRRVGVMGGSLAIPIAGSMHAVRSCVVLFGQRVPAIDVPIMNRVKA